MTFIVAVSQPHIRLFAGGGSPAVVKHRPVTVDDLLKQEDWGRALIDPTGRWLVFDQSPPYDQLPDYGIERAGGVGEPTFGRIMVIDLTAPASPRLLFEPEPQSEYRIQSFSPNGQRLALYEVKHGSVHLGIYDIPSGRLKTFNGAPEIALDRGSPAIWISSDEMVYLAFSEARQPWSISIRRYTGTRLVEAWDKSWKGREPSVAQVISHADGGGKDLRDGLLLKANARIGTTELLARGWFTDLKLSSDGSFIAGLQQREAMQPTADRLINSRLLISYHLMIIDLNKKRNWVVLPEMNVLDGSIEWSPTSDALAFFGWRKDANRQAGLFHVYDARTGQTKAWPHAGLDLASISFQRPGRPAWLNGQLAVVARPNVKGDETPRFSYQAVSERNGLGRVDWFLLNPTGATQNLTAAFGTVLPTPVNVTAKGLCLLADGNVWRIAPEGTKTNLTSGAGGGLAPALDVDRARVPSPSIAFVAQEQGKSKYILVDTTGDGRVVTIALPSSRASLMAGSVRAGVALFRENTDEGTKLVLVHANGSRTEVGWLNQHLAEVAKPEWRTISYHVKGGRELQSGMFLPYSYTPGKRYPVVVETYPSRLSSSSSPSTIGEHFSFYAPELLATTGYIVFYPANPDDVNRTKDGPISGMAAVVLQGVDALVAQGYADPDRICLMGFSQGGFSSLWLATETDRFKAIVSINGWTDIASHYFAQGIYQTFYSDQVPFSGESGRYESAEFGRTFGIGGTPWQDAGAYFRNSPLYRADKIKTPIMLIHSDMDGFPLSQYEMMFTALYRLRKEARLVRYWGEGHGPSSPANIRDMWYRTFAWFDEWSDISRDTQGNLIWVGDKVKSRNGSAPLKPEDFARFDQMILRESQSKTQSVQRIQ
ncbi:MAG TPA: prolyl oligopeptidase family serine peptidase [Pyrinomonadaceae bacterium]|nr:prolyl oligopeptidase family serine peptidase [Pyrinomonadaceae bacterium]